jgi:TonB family protein
MEKQAGPGAATQPPSDTTPGIRLVIRAEIIPDDDPQPPARRRPGRRALVLVIVAVTVLALGGIGIRMLRTEPPARPAASTANAKPAAAMAVEPDSTAAKSVESAAPKNPDASPLPLHEVIPDVPQSARQTIRGTVKVTVRVIVDRQGMVLAATPDDPGPSPYFARLAVEASKQWTFAPANTDEQRVMRVRFNFTRAGTTARANP